MALANPIAWLRQARMAGSSITRATPAPTSTLPGTTKAAPDFLGPGAQGTPAPGRTAYARQLTDFLGTPNDSVQLGPSAPPYPQPLDSTGLPRQYQYRVGWNIPSQPGEGRPLSLFTLREMAQAYDLMRKAIEIRKDELCSLEVDIVARDPDKRRARQIIHDQQDKIDEIRQFWQRPDGDTLWQSWLRSLLEDHFVVDALTLWKWRDWGGKLIGLRQLDGATIKPLLSIQGDRPKPPDWAYQQYLYGVPRESFTSEELIYAPKNRRVWTPYGNSPVEQFIQHITTALNWQQQTLTFFTDGTIPEGVASVAAEMTPAQLAELNQYWDGLLSGDQRAFRKLNFVPAGFEWHALKPWSWDVSFAYYLMTVTCSMFDITPQELGFAPQHGGGLGGKGFAEEQTVVLKRKSLGPLIKWLCDEVLNPVIWEEFDAPDLVMSLRMPGEEEEELQRAQAIDLMVRNGTKSIDEVVEDDGGEPPGIGRVFVVGNSIYGLPDLINLTTQGVASLTPPPAPAPAPSGSEPPAQGGQQQAHAEQQQSDLPPPAREVAAKDTNTAPTASKAAEVERFLRFARDRQQSGKWRDFRSTVIPDITLAAMNQAAAAGASGDELRALVGMDDQPERFKATVGDTERAYRGFTRQLAKRVSEKLSA